MMSGGRQLNRAPADEAAAAAMYSTADTVRDNGVGTGRDDNSAKSTANYTVRVNHIVGDGDDNEGRAEGQTMVRVNVMDDGEDNYVGEGATTTTSSYASCSSTTTATTTIDNTNLSSTSSSSSSSSSTSCSSNRPSSWMTSRLAIMASRLSMSISSWPTIPRRLTHPLKVGLALSVVSLSILQSDIFRKLGSVDAIWAVMTVVLVFELTAGATFYKGLNRALGTLLAGILSLIVELLADSAGPRGEPYVIGISVFIVGAMATFARYCEGVKSRCEYGVVVFLLSFSMIVVSGYREEGSDLGLAVSRFATILLGVGVCMLVSVLVWPAWAGDDLHNAISHNFGALAGALEESMVVYFKRTRVYGEDSLSDPSYLQNNIILHSRAKEESLANFANWEPRIFRENSSNIVWKQYLEVGGKLRSCSYIVASLHACFRSSVQVPLALRRSFSNPCFNIGVELAKLIKELGKSVKRHEELKSKDELMSPLLEKVKNFKKDMDACTILLLRIQRTNLIRKEQVIAPQSWWPPSSHHVNEEKAQLFVHDMCEVSKKLVDTSTCNWQSSTSENLVEETKCTHNNTNGNQILVHSSQPKVQAYDGKIEDETLASFDDFLSMASIAFLLIELVLRVEHLVDAVKSLERLASFKTKESIHQKVTPQPLHEDFHDDGLLLGNDPQHSYTTIRVM